MTAEEANDIIIDMLPDAPYTPCPCGCKRIWRYIVRDPVELEKHIDEWHTRLMTQPIQLATAQLATA